MGLMGACVGALGGGATYKSGLLLLGNHERVKK